MKGGRKREFNSASGEHRPLRWHMRYSFGVLAIVLAGMPAYLGLTQGIALVTYERVPAAVTGVGVRSRPGHRGTVFEPVVTYEFQRAGRVYVGSRYRFAAYASRDEDRARARAARYHEGDHVQVLVDPRDPNNSVLRGEVDWSPYGVAVALLATVFVIYRSEVRRQKAI